MIPESAFHYKVMMAARKRRTDRVMFTRDQVILDPINVSCTLNTVQNLAERTHSSSSGLLAVQAPYRWDMNCATLLRLDPLYVPLFSDWQPENMNLNFDGRP